MGEQSVPLERFEELSREIASTRRRIEERSGLLRDRITSKELVRPVMDRLRDTLGAGGEKLLDAFRDNPIPMTLAGIGLGWLLLRDRAATERRQRRPRSAGSEASGTEGDRDTVPPAGSSGARGKLGGAANHVREAAKKNTRETIEWFERTLDQNPLVLTVGALAAGMVAGLVIPVRDPEETAAGSPGKEGIQSPPGAVPQPSSGSPPAQDEKDPPKGFSSGEAQEKVEVQAEGDRSAPSASSGSME